VLLECQAATRFLSCEPLLEPVSISDALARAGLPVEERTLRELGLDWVIVGGESGDEARPMHPGWARTLKAECDAGNVAFFFKQNGTWSTPHPRKRDKLVGLMPSGREVPVGTAGSVTLAKLGAKRAGDLLDGKQYQAYP
jgi:protein gp37